MSSFAALSAADTSYSVDVTVSNNTGTGGTLFGWIDFDGDGSFQADEGASVAVADGTTGGTATLNWTGLGGAGPDITDGDTFARFRLTSDGSISTATPGGAASDGEVEDYTLAIAAPLPVANPDMVERFAFQSVKIPVATLLSNDSSPAGNTPLTVDAVTYTGGNGASVTLSNGLVLYNPNGFTAQDTFEYTLKDSAGLTSQGTVTVKIKTESGATPNLVKMETLPGGDVSLTYAGIPGRSYRFQSSGDLTNWVNRATIIADAQGMIEFVETVPVPSPQFYRTISP